MGWILFGVAILAIALWAFFVYSSFITIPMAILGAAIAYGTVTMFTHRNSAEAALAGAIAGGIGGAIIFLPLFAIFGRESSSRTPMAGFGIALGGSLGAGITAAIGLHGIKVMTIGTIIGSTLGVIIVIAGGEIVESFEEGFRSIILSFVVVIIAAGIGAVLGICIGFLFGVNNEIGASVGASIGASTAAFAILMIKPILKMNVGSIGIAAVIGAVIGTIIGAGIHAGSTADLYIGVYSWDRIRGSGWP